MDNRRCVHVINAIFTTCPYVHRGDGLDGDDNVCCHPT